MNKNKLQKIIVSAPGKIHLSGEHSVIYGKPALLAAVNKRVSVTAYKVPKISGQKTYGCFPDIVIQKTYEFLQKEQSKNICLEIQSELPLGCGMGSSAAVSAAIISAIFGIEKITCNLEKINNIVYETEKIMHNNPSGADNTVITYGGLVCFEKKEKTPVIQKLVTTNFPELLLINSGKPIESTGDMVNIVAKKYKMGKVKYKKIFGQMGEVTENMCDIFGQNNFEQNNFNNFGELITQNQRLLEQMGVVGRHAKYIIKLIEKFGGAAKISGAGGVKSGSGIIIAFAPDMQKLKYYLKKNNITFFNAKISQEGCDRVACDGVSCDEISCKGVARDEFGEGI